MYHIIVNPASKSGLGKKQWADLRSILDHKKFTYLVHFTKSGKDATEYTRRITDRQLYRHNAQPNRIVVLGGDGTLNCVLNGIDDMEHTIVTYLPTGTSNDFARALHISSDPVCTSAVMKKGGVLRKTDVGLAKCGHTSRRFLVSCGIGYDAAICREVLGTPSKGFLNRIGLGKLVYLLIALKQLLFIQPVSCDLYLDDKPPIHFNRLYFATFMQLPYEGGGFPFCPKADSGDGLLDVCLFANIRKLHTLPLFPLAMRARHIGQRGVYTYRARKIRIVTSKPLCVHTDGEICGNHSQLCVTADDTQFLYRR